MMRPILFSAALVAAASAASAQSQFSAAKKAAQNAAAATNAHIEAEQRPDDQQASTPRKAASVATQPAKTSAASSVPATSSKPTPSAKTTASTKGGKAPISVPVNPADTAGPPPSIYREVFDYTRDGRRDPFNSLMSTSELRPTMSDLRLTGVLFDPSGRRSGATLRDVSNNSQYRVSVGSTLGRMRVSSIRNKTVVFTIEEFGTTRQDSLVLGDSTKVRRP